MLLSCVRLRPRYNASFARRQSHLGKHGAAEKPVGICERLQHLEMIVAFADQHSTGLPARLYRGEEISASGAGIPAFRRCHARE